MYDVPTLDDDLIEEMICHPFETHSDSFYFVGDELIMHNKARYRYITEHAMNKGLSNSAESKDMVCVGYNNCNDKERIRAEDSDASFDNVKQHHVSNDLSSSFGEAKISHREDEERFYSSAEAKENDVDAKYGDTCWVKDTEYEAKR